MVKNLHKVTKVEGRIAAIEIIAIPAHERVYYYDWAKKFYWFTEKNIYAKSQGSIQALDIPEVCIFYSES